MVIWGDRLSSHHSQKYSQKGSNCGDGHDGIKDMWPVEQGPNGQKGFVAKIFWGQDGQNEYGKCHK